VFPTAFLLLITWPFLTQTELLKANTPRDPDSIHAGIYSATDANEYLPLAASAPPPAPRADVVLSSDGAALQFTGSDGSRHSIGVQAERDNAVLMLGLYDFPGWKVKTLSGPAQAKLSATSEGQLELHLPLKGEYRLRVYFGATPAGLLGGLLSTLSALALALIVARGSRFWPLPLPATAKGAT